jgi:PKHD-type hydroxylase
MTPLMFKNEELNDIVKLGLSEELVTGAIAQGKQDNAIRDCRRRNIWPHEAPWLMRRLQDVVSYSNANNFGFNLDGFAEGLQFTEYNAPHGKYEYHIDQIIGGIVRKLTVVVQLSNPEDYEGGDLQLQLGHAEPFTFPRDRGMVIMFPSFYLHRVTPVTRGTRYSLVGWVTGKQFE